MKGCLNVAGLAFGVGLILVAVLSFNPILFVCAIAIFFGLLADD